MGISQKKTKVLITHCEVVLFYDDHYLLVLEPIIVFTMGYLSYILADMFEFSGIVR